MHVPDRAKSAFYFTEEAFSPFFSFSKTPGRARVESPDNADAADADFLDAFYAYGLLLLRDALLRILSSVAGIRSG